MPFIKKYKNPHNYSRFVLGGDVGGTNTSIGIFGIKNKKSELIFSFRFKSKELSGLHDAVKEVMSYAEENHKINVSKACFAVAGLLSPDKENSKVTNVKWDVSKKSLLRKTSLRKICIMNDFEAIGYGIFMLGSKNLKAIKKAKRAEKAPILIIGAGTGLGKSTLIYDNSSKTYIPLPSEAGHSDFAAQTREELDLADFVRKYKKISGNVTYEQVLSGPGLINIYMFLRKSGKLKATKFTKEIDGNPNPELISKYRKTDQTCKKAFQIFKRIYAKFARNFALDSLAWGGCYIAGGIAPKNMEIFDNEFVRIFCQSHKMSRVLRKTPIYLVLDSNVGMLGAGFRAGLL